MKYIKSFESYKIEILPPFYSHRSYYELPDYFNDGDLFEYFKLTYIDEHHYDDYEYDDSHYNTEYKDKDRKSWRDIDYCNYKLDSVKRLRVLRSDILSYINDFYRFDDNYKKYGFDYTPNITDFNFIWDFNSKNEDKEQIRTLRCLSIKTYSGTYKTKPDESEELIKYLSDPELYLNTKKYNL